MIIFLRDDALIAPAEHAGSSILKTLFSAFLLLSASTIGATETPYSAFYSLDADGMSIGNLERSLTRTKEEIFVLNTKSYATGFWKLFFDDVIAEESRFTIFKGKVVPQSYLYTKKRKGELSEERLTFNHHKNTILSNSNDGQVNFGFTGVETDKLLYQFMIREALRDGGGERDLDFSVVDKGGVHPYRFKVGAIESLVTNIGTIDAVRVDRINEERRKTTIWFAPSLDYLPVKIVQDAGDHNYSSTIISTSLKR